MNSHFLEGLQSALQLVKSEGIEALEALIKEHESGSIETAAVRPQAETR